MNEHAYPMRPSLMRANWDDRAVNILCSRWGFGPSVREIASELGPSFTRNAVIGKAHRMGLAPMARAPSKPRVIAEPKPKCEPKPKLPKKAKPMSVAKPVAVAPMPADTIPAGYRFSMRYCKSGRHRRSSGSSWRSG